MWKVTSVRKGGRLGRNQWWRYKGRELYKERKERWDEEKRKDIEEEKGIVLFSIWTLLLREPLCKAWCIFISWTQVWSLNISVLGQSPLLLSFLISYRFYWFGPSLRGTSHYSKWAWAPSHFSSPYNYYIVILIKLLQ